MNTVFPNSPLGVLMDDTPTTDVASIEILGTLYGLPSQTSQLSVRCRNAAGEDVEKAVTWATLNPTVVLVDNSGLATFLVPGQATITATVDSIVSNAVILTVRDQDAPAPTDGDILVYNEGTDRWVAQPKSSTIAEVSGLQDALNGKADSEHGHALADIVVVGTPDGSKFLRDDGSWAIAGAYPPEGGEVGVVNTRYPRGHGKRYGALGDGINDTQALLNMVASARSYGETFLDGPASAYVCKAPLVTSRATTIRGEHENTALVFDGLGAQYGIDMDGTLAPNLEAVILKSLTLMATDATTDLVRMRNASNCELNNIILRGGRNGVVQTGNRGFSNRFKRVYNTIPGSGSAILFDNFTGGGPHVFDMCSFGGYAGISISSGSLVSGLVSNGTNYEACGFAGISVAGSLLGAKINGGRFEKNQGSASIVLVPGLGEFVYGFDMSGVHLETDAELWAVQMGGAGGEVRGFSITGNVAQDYASDFIRLNGDGQSGQIINNRLRTTTSVVNVVRPGVLVLNNENEFGPIGPQWAPPLVTPAALAEATDLPSALALVNDLRAMALDVGLRKTPT